MENPPWMTPAQSFIDLACRRDCKDDRDRIYAMLGIVEDTGIQPNYTLTRNDPFSGFVSKSLASGDFSILHACCFNPPRPELPSYVPGFGASSSFYVPIAHKPLESHHHFRNFKAGGEFPAKIAVDGHTGFRFKEFKWTVCITG